MLLWSCSRMTQLHTCNQCLFTVPSTLFCLTKSRNFFSCILLLDIELHNPPKLIQCDNLVHSSETAQWGPCQCAQTGPLLKVVHRHRTDFLGTLVPGPERHTNLKYISKQDEFFFKIQEHRQADMLERDRSAVHGEKPWCTIWTHNQQNKQNKQTNTWPLQSPPLLFSWGVGALQRPGNVSLVQVWFQTAYLVCICAWGKRKNGVILTQKSCHTVDNNVISRPYTLTLV